MLTPVYQLRRNLLELEKSGLSWGQITEKLYPGDADKSHLRVVLYRMAHKKYEPKSNDMRDRLGIPRIYMVSACHRCGVVHSSGCPNASPVYAPGASKPLRPPAAPRARRAISLTDPESAACTILSKADGDYVDRLIELLQVRRYYE